MCCFTLPVKSVSETRIFARAAEHGRQYVVYSMRLDADNDLAMVLPLPVKSGTNEKSVTFINLKEYPGFFHDMEKGFPKPAPTGIALHQRETVIMSGVTLEVLQVGDFEASFVPTEADFLRLDERFRLPPGTWQKLPQYAAYGFAVFKLKPGANRVHPMAFSFPRQDPAKIFFPTVHIHDGTVHVKAEFDHTLYCQSREGEAFKYSADQRWEESQGHARNFMHMDETQGVIEADQHCYKATMHGNLPNCDTVVEFET
jgi:hypothetical protein